MSLTPLLAQNYGSLSSVRPTQTQVDSFIAQAQGAPQTNGPSNLIQVVDSLNISASAKKTIEQSLAVHALSHQNSQNGAAMTSNGTSGTSSGITFNGATYKPHGVHARRDHDQDQNSSSQGANSSKGASSSINALLGMLTQAFEAGANAESALLSGTSSPMTSPSTSGSSTATSTTGASSVAGTATPA